MRKLSYLGCNKQANNLNKFHNNRWFNRKNSGRKGKEKRRMLIRRLLWLMCIISSKWMSNKPFSSSSWRLNCSMNLLLNNKKRKMQKNNNISRNRWLCSNKWSKHNNNMMLWWLKNNSRLMKEKIKNKKKLMKLKLNKSVKDKLLSLISNSTSINKISKNKMMKLIIKLLKMEKLNNKNKKWKEMKVKVSKFNTSSLLMNKGSNLSNKWLKPTCMINTTHSTRKRNASSTFRWPKVTTSKLRTKPHMAKKTKKQENSISTTTAQKNWPI